MDCLYFLRNVLLIPGPWSRWSYQTDLMMSYPVCSVFSQKEAPGKVSQTICCERTNTWNHNCTFKTWHLWQTPSRVSFKTHNIVKSLNNCAKKVFEQSMTPDLHIIIIFVDFWVCVIWQYCLFSTHRKHQKYIFWHIWYIIFTFFVYFEDTFIPK